MKRLLLLCTVQAAYSLFASASPILTSGTPGNAQLATPAGPIPSFGSLINFDALIPNTPLNAGQYSSQGIASIASPDGLTVIPFSAQSSPNEIFDASADGTADVTIKLNQATSRIGVGISDSDPVTVTLQALDVNGLALGGAFVVTIPQNTINPGNGYYVISDSSANIAGLEILQTSSDSSYSGLAIDDLQVAAVATIPEPATLVLGMGGLLALGLNRLRRKSS